MKYLRLLNILPIGLFICALLALPAMAYSIDGDLSDWGVNLVAAYNGDNNGWHPSSSTADWIVENNIYSPLTTQYPSAYPDWTGYKSTGYHMQKNGLMKNPEEFKEDPMALSGSKHLAPSGGEPYDIEALYFDDDNQNVYLAVVTSMDQNGYDETSTWDNNYGRHTDAGDIAIDLDQNNAYEYGIVTHAAESGESSHIGDLITKPKWTLPQGSSGFSDNAPSDCSLDPSNPQSTYLGHLDFAYIKRQNKIHGLSDIKETVDYGSKGMRDVYKNIIEVKIPKSLIGSPSADTLSNIHITIGCGNDFINLTPVRFDRNIPEFPSIVLPVAAILGIIFILDRRNKK
jgi:hypothetical protein